MICSSVNLFTKPLSILTITLALGLSGCGGGGDSSPAPTITPPPPDETVETHSITGGGVKGPLANAVVTVFAFDAAQAGFKGAAVGTALTDASAAITGLALPFPLNPPYIMEFTSTPATTTDITTGMFPVITRMRTVITQASLDAGEQIYATPLTTIAVDMAVANAGTGATSAQFETALTAAAAQVVSTLGFGMDSSVNIFDTPPLINSTTVGTAEQVAVAAYRTAVEAVTAIAYQINQQSTGASTDTVLADLAADLADGGIIDGSAGTTLNSNTLQVLEQDPASLPIPNSTQTVADVQAILAAETATTGSTTTTSELTDGTIITDSEPAETDSDLDADGVLNADDAYPNDATADTDTDGDGAPDIAWTDASRATEDVARSDTDDDNDGWLDIEDDYTTDVTRFLDPALDRDIDTVANGTDNCPLTSNTDQLDTDSNGQGDACSNDSDGDGVDDGVDNCPLVANPSQTDTGGSADGDVCDINIDGDSADNTVDAFPYDPTEIIDTDGDGIGNTADADDDNDGVLDGADSGVAPAGTPVPGIACNVLRDCDADGVLDGADYNPVDDSVTFNFAPVTADAAITTDEDVAVAVTLSVTDDGVAAGPLVYNISGPAHGVLSGTEPDLTYTPNAEFSGSDSFIFTVVDGAGKMSNISGVDITVVAVNDAPIIAQPGPLSVEMDEDASPIAFAAPVINASDKEGDTLTWSLSSVATNGVATVSGTGEAPTITYVPDADTNGSDSFDVTVSDGNGGSDVITIDVTVNAKNDAPVIAVAGPFSIAENAVDTTTVGSVIAADIDGPVTGYSISAGNTGNAFAISTGGQITVADTTVIDYENATSFSLTITATDGVDLSAGVVVVVNISDVNDTLPVVGAAGPFAIAEDAANTTAVGTVTATDADTDTGVTGYTITSGDAGGAFAISAAGAITVADTSAIDYETATSFNLTVTATDGVNTSAGVVIVVNVSDANDSTPVVDAVGPFSVAEDDANSTVVGTVTATDADTATAVTDYAIASGNTGTAFAIDAAGEITIVNASAIDYESATSFSLGVTATDGLNTSVEQAVIVNITDANDSTPVVDVVGPFSVAEDDANSTVVGTVTATDTDTATGVTGYAIASGNTGAAFAVDAAGEITIINASAIDYESATSFSLGVTATDGLNISVEQAVVVNITDANDSTPVVATSQAFNVLETAIVSTVVGTVSATDEDTATSITGFTITVGNTGTAFAIDASGEITVANSPLSGTYSLSVTATDGVNTSAAETVTVTAVTNTPPLITQGASVSVTMDEDASPTAFVAPTIDATDAEGDTLTWSTPGASNGTATVSGTGASPTVTYVPNADYNGDDSFVVNVNDSTSTVGITVNVTITSINDTPSTLGDDAGSTDEDTLLTTLNVLTNDSDNDGPVALSVSSFDVGSANGGIVFYNDNGTFDYTPAPDFNGEDSFNYTVTDGEDTSSASVTITVAAVNDAPVAVDDAEMAIVDALNVTGNVLTNDEDVDGPSLSITASDTVSLNGGTVFDNGNGTFNYTSANGYTGPDSFNYTVSDGLLSDTGTVNITVTPAGTTIAMTDLLGATEGGIAGLESWVNAQSVNEYQYWKDIYDGATTFSYEDRFFSRLTAAFEIETDGGPDISLNGAGSWVNQGAFRVVTPDNGDGSMTVAVRDETDSIDLETITLSALYADISGQPIANYLDAQWQSAMFDSTATFGVNAKQVTAYTFEHDVDAYLMFSGDWCQDTDPTRYATLNTTAVNNNCNGIDVPTGIDASGFATSLSQLEVSTPFVDINDGADPDVRVGFGWEGNTTLVVEFAPGNVANYYVIDWAGSDADHTDKVATGTYVRDTTIQGVDMIRFIPPAAAYVQFPEVMEESSGYQVSVEGGFVRLGDYILAGTARTDISGLLNGHALDEILANFSGDNYTTANLAGKTIYDMYQDTDVDEYLIDVYTFDADGTFTTYDYQTGLPSQETGTWDVNTSGKLHLTMTSGPDNGVQFWAKAKGMNPDNGSQRACFADNIAGPFKCSFLDVALGITSRQFNDETTAVNKMNKRNSLDPQTSQARTPNLKQFDGSRTRISGLWIGEFDVASLTTGTHTLDFGEGPATLTFNIDGTGVMEFSPTETNTITSWSIDFNGVLRFTEQASDSSTADWTIGYFEAQVPGNVLVYFVGDDGSQFFVMGGFDQTLAQFPDAATLAGTTKYNVYFDEDTEQWELESLVFDADGSTYTLTTLPSGTPEVGTYSVTNGILNLVGYDYIQIMSVDAATGAERTCWDSSLANLSNCDELGYEFFFDNQTDAQNFLDSLTFTAGAAVDATALLAAGIYEFWDDEWDGSQQVPAYWNLSVNGAIIVDGDFVWSRALHKFLPQSYNTADVMLTTTGWQVGTDDIADVVISGNQATLNFRAPDDELVQSVVVTFEAMDISGREIGLYAPHILLDNVSATFTSGAEWVRESVINNLTYTQLSVWDGCGDYATWGDNCNVVLLRAIDGTNTVDLTFNATTSIVEFDGVATQTIELGYDAGNGNLLGVFDGAGNITLYGTNFTGPATIVGSGTYTISTDVNGISGLDIIDYTLPAGFENTYNLFYDVDEGETGILAVHNGFLRHGEREPSGAGGTYMDLNSLAANDVFNNQPAAAINVGTWVSSTTSSNGDPLIQHLFGDGQYEAAGTCDFDGTDGAEHGTGSWNQSTGAVSATATVSTMGACSTELGAANGNTVAISGDVLTLSIPSVGDQTYNRLTITANPIVGTWVLNSMADYSSLDANGDFTHATLTFINDTQYILEQAVDTTNCGTSATFGDAANGAGREFGSYTWNSSTGEFTRTILADSTGDCGFDDFSGGEIFTVDGDNMYLGDPAVDGITFHRLQ